MKTKILFVLGVFCLILTSCKKERIRVPPDEHFYAYTAFTPNNDYINDKFIIYPHFGVIVDEFYMEIYNQNLDLVFSTHDMYGNLWDGTTPGNGVEYGYYEYQIEYKAAPDSFYFMEYITTGQIHVLP